MESAILELNKTMNKETIIVLLLVSAFCFSPLITLAFEVTGGLSNQGVIPVAPSGVTVSKTGDHEITLSWNAVGGAEGYKIYRKKDSENFLLVKDNETALSYKDGSLSDGVYFYQVQSFIGTLMPNLDDIAPTPPITISTSTAGGVGPTGGGGPTVLGTSTSSGDTNNDGKVDILDFNALIVNWGAGGGNSVADFNKDGKVDIFDFNFLMAHWS